ncbi:hypothetical protein ACS0Y7_27340 [Burkholderia gladioli]|uniref:hypothetical protein n=1 Tax=Burkholderia gladioli TaxID=28095 RepID=UPI003F7A7D5B
MSFTIHACRSTIRFRGTTVTDIAVSRGDTVPKGSSRSCSASDCGTEAKPPSGTGTPTLISGKAAAGRDREHRGTIASPFLSLRGSCERKCDASHSYRNISVDMPKNEKHCLPVFRADLTILNTAKARAPCAGAICCR